MQRLTRTALVTAVAAALATSFAANAQQTQSLTPAFAVTAQDVADASSPTLLMLKSGLFDPRTQQLDYRSHGLADVADARHAVVQFTPGSDAAVRARLAALGVTVLGYLPSNAYRVATNGVTIEAIQSAADVRWAGYYRSGWKVSPELWADSGNPIGITMVDLSIDAFGGESAADLAATLIRRIPNAIVLNVRESDLHPRVRVQVPATSFDVSLNQIAALDTVQYVEFFRQPHFENDDAVGPMQSGTATTTSIWDRDIIGTGQIVAIADSGLDHNESWFTRYDPGTGVVNLMTDASSPTLPATGPTFPDRKVYGYWVQPGATAYDNNNVCSTSPTSFHGTHTSATIAGDRGVATATPTDPGHDANGDDGMAPNAQLLFQDIGNDTSGCLSITDFANTLRQANAGGARIHNNSWGASTAGVYSGNDVDLDGATWEMESIMVVVSAGNDGPGGTTIGSPGVAKNAMTVGALGHGNATTIASFSSRGPTADTRVKPDIVAPGSSTVSAAGNSNNDPVEQAGTSKALSGTSMSAPTVAGTSALMRQYFEDGYYPRGAKTAADAVNPNAALMKAVLLNGTQILGVWPTQTFGWGRMQLESNLFFNSAIGGGGSADPRRMRYFERVHAAGLATGESHSYTINAVGAGQELRVTLTWMDPEGDAAAAVSLVNNLDLEVTGPAGTYKGNVLTAGASLPTAAAADARNTVEQIRIVAPAAGAYTITVKGTAVPGNGRANSQRQGYAVVASGEFGLPDGAPNAAPTAPTIVSNNTSGVSVGFTGAAPQGFQLYRAPGTCATASAKEFRLVATGNASPIVDDRTQGGFSYAYKIRGIANDVEGNASTCIDVVSADTCTNQPSFNRQSLVRDFSNDTCQVNLDWSAATSNCPLAPAVSYRVERSTSPLFTSPTVLATVTTPSYDDLAVTYSTPYYYRVTPIDGAANESAPSVVVSATPVAGNGPISVGFKDDVDDNTYMTLESPWAVSNLNASTGTFSYRNAPLGNATYPSNTCAEIRTPPLEIVAGQTLSYDARWNLEQNWDGVVVEISTDGGSTWNDLPPQGGYPGTFADTGNPPVNACGYASTHGAFNGSSANAFVTKTNDLAAFAGQTIQVRWRMSSDPAAEELGFFLDNVKINGGGVVLPDPILTSSFEDGETQPTPPPGGPSDMCTN